MKKFLQRAGVSFAGVLAAAVSLGAMADEPSQLPRERSVGIVSFVSGGVDIDEAHRFEAEFKRFPLAIELFEKEGAREVFTASAHVVITDRHGERVFDQVADGPFVLLRLPAGDYRVEASLAGHSLAAHPVHVTASGHARTTFVWPESTG
ncbi:MAG: hypothetical protein ABI433_19040 [Burkholderiaceae bacterium]